MLDTASSPLFLIVGIFFGVHRIISFGADWVHKYPFLDASTRSVSSYTHPTLVVVHVVSSLIVLMCNILQLTFTKHSWAHKLRGYLISVMMPMAVFTSIVLSCNTQRVVDIMVQLPTSLAWIWTWLNSVYYVIVHVDQLKHTQYTVLCCSNKRSSNFETWCLHSHVDVSSLVYNGIYNITLCNRHILSNGHHLELLQGRDGYLLGQQENQLQPKYLQKLKKILWSN